MIRLQLFLLDEFLFYPTPLHKSIINGCLSGTYMRVYLLPTLHQSYTHVTQFIYPNPVQPLSLSSHFIPILSPRLKTVVPALKNNCPRAVGTFVPRPGDKCPQPEGLPADGFAPSFPLFLCSCSVQ